MSDCVLQSVYCKHCNIVQVHQWAAAHVGRFSIGRIVLNKEQPLITRLVMKLYLGNCYKTLFAQSLHTNFVVLIKSTFTNIGKQRCAFQYLCQAVAVFSMQIWEQWLFLLPWVYLSLYLLLDYGCYYIHTAYTAESDLQYDTFTS